MRKAARTARGRALLMGWCIALALGVAATTVCAKQPPALNSISAHVVSLRNDRGRVVCSLFDSAAGGFPRDGDKAIRQLSVPIERQAATCNFTDVPSGTYAITVFHDENANAHFDMTWLGLPDEGYGFSNDARAVFAPPSFLAASFRCAGGGTLHLTIHIRY
ncbi:MAG: DUF2141 domain-containing protein [Candidatus Binataceae bacterium]